MRPLRRESSSCYARLIMRDYVESKITEGRAKVQDLRGKLLAAEGELRAYEDMLAHLPAVESPALSPNSAHLNIVGARVGLSVIPSEMTGGWRSVLAKVGDGGKSFDAAAVAEAAAEFDVPSKMTNARSQLYQWQQKHIIARVRKGRYKLTPKGIEVAKKTEGSEAGAAEPSGG
jgi:hypothetical protein